MKPVALISIQMGSFASTAPPVTLKVGPFNEAPPLPGLPRVIVPDCVVYGRSTSEALIISPVVGIEMDVFPEESLAVKHSSNSMAPSASVVF